MGSGLSSSTNRQIGLYIIFHKRSCCVQKNMLNFWQMILFSEKATSNNLLAFLNLLSGLVFFFFKKRMLKASFGFCKAWFSKEPGFLWKLEMKFDAYTTLTLYGEHFYKVECKRSAWLEDVFVSSGWILWQVGQWIRFSLAMEISQALGWG